MRWEFILAGFIGGLLRALLGVAKAIEKNKINPYYLGVSLLNSALLGGVIGSFVAQNFYGGWELAFLFGYSSTDFVEGLYKAYIKRVLKRAK